MIEDTDKDLIGSSGYSNLLKNEKQGKVSTRMWDVVGLSTFARELRRNSINCNERNENHWSEFEKKMLWVKKQINDIMHWIDKE